MKYYSDESNKAAANVMFLLLQILVLFTVYGFVYTSFVAVKLAIAEYHLTFMTYLPEVLALLLFPVVLYKTRKMFARGKRVRATVWMMAWASVIIVALYAHLSQLISV